MLVILLACSDNALSGKDNNEVQDTASSADTAATGDTGGTDDTPRPEWFTLAATATLVDGAPTATTAESIIVDEDQSTEICRVPIDTTGFVGTTPPADEIAVWWELPAIVIESDCPLGITDVAFGIGALDPEARARLGQVDKDGIANQLYGAYARVENGDIYAIGYAEAANPEDVAVFPPPDDDYSLVPLFLLPLP